MKWNKKYFTASFFAMLYLAQEQSLLVILYLQNLSVEK